MAHPTRRGGPRRGPDLTGRRVGVEEEFLLIDPATRETSSRAPLVVAVAAVATGELQREQVETGSVPHTSRAALRADLLARRRELAVAAEATGSRVLALATHPDRSRPSTSPGERYASMTARFGLVAREQLTCACHVHVEVTDRDEAAAVLDRIRPWTPLLLALSTNSPFWQGEDTGHAGYRSRVWNRWPTAGPTSPVGSARGYDDLVAAMLGTGVPLDQGMVYFDTRLSATYPTLEIRVPDVCLRVEDAVLVAVLARALVETGLRAVGSGEPLVDVPVEVLRLMNWRAAHDGVDGVLVSPSDSRPRPAADVLAELLAHTAEALQAADDAEFARDAVARVLDRGSGARWQRRSLDELGVPDMLSAAADLTVEAG